MQPVILLGNGARDCPRVLEHLFGLNVPILTTWMAADLLAEDHPSFCGRPGILGQRAANIIQQKASHLYCIGARLDGEQVAYAYDRFGGGAEVWAFDVDAPELDKLPDGWHGVKVDLTRIKSFSIERGPDEWLAWCKALYARFRPELDGSDELDMFSFMRLLSDAGQPDDVFAIGSSGNSPTAFFQTFKVKAGQRIHNVSTIGAMGADVPMALGSALASGRRTICVTGDGGFHLNAQELETIHRMHLPVTFFVVNNDGYASIRANQDLRFDGRRVGCDPKNGLTLPDLSELANAYGFMYKSIRRLDDFDGFASFPLIVEVFIDPDWVQRPRVMASWQNGEYVIDNMDDMTPKVDYG